MTTATRTGDHDVLELFGTADDLKAGAKGRETQMILIEEIELDPDQPRKEADADLCDDLRIRGLLQPITVRPNPDPVKVKEGYKYRNVFGERRILGMVKLGKTVIEAFVRDDALVSNDARRLISQLSENKHKKLEPIEVARTLRQVQELTGATMVELAEISGMPKSTVMDRLALANAPAPFQPLFVSGILSASAAPILAKFSDVPLAILDDVVALAQHDFAWSEAIRNEKPVPLKDVERVLTTLIIDDRLAEVTEQMAMLYHGPTCKVDGLIYATDRGEFTKVEKKFQAEQRRAAEAPKPAPAPAAASQATDDLDDDEAGRPGSAENHALFDDEDLEDVESEDVEEGAAPRRAAPPKMSAAERKRIEAEKRAREQAERDALLFKESLPAILKAIGNEIEKAPTGSVEKLGKYVFEILFDHIGFDNMAAGKFVARGTNAADLLRHMAMCIVHAAIEAGDWRLTDIPTQLAKLGVKVDLRKVLDAAAAKAPKGLDLNAKTPKKKTPAPKAKAKPAKPAKRAKKGKR